MFYNSNFESKKFSGEKMIDLRSYSINYFVN